jgi:hypothetical protein
MLEYHQDILSSPPIVTVKHIKILKHIVSGELTLLREHGFIPRSLGEKVG